MSDSSVPELGSRLAGLAGILRPHNCLAAALLTFLGAHLGGGAVFTQAWPLLRAASVVWLVVAACNVINDVRDVAADRLNNPQRPIPSGRVPLRLATALALCCATLALAVAWTLGPWLVGIAVSLMALGVGYSFGLKGTVLVGNGVVSFLASSPLAYGALVAGRLTLHVAAAALLVFVFVLLREILGTMSDREGDLAAGLRTVSTTWGMPAALRMLQILALLFAVASVTPWLLHLASDRYVVVMLVCCTLPTVGVVTHLSLRPGKDTIRLSLRVTKWLWFSSLLPLLLLK